MFHCNVKIISIPGFTQVLERGVKNPSRDQCSVRAYSVLADKSDSNNPPLKNLTPSASANAPLDSAGLKAKSETKDEYQGRTVDVLSETKKHLAQLSARNLSPLHATSTMVRNQAKQNFKVL